MLNKNDTQTINFAKGKYNAKSKRFIEKMAAKWAVTMRDAEVRILTEQADLDLNKTKNENINDY